jgi:aryl-alcohol dehydrogenase-like predicted oxidoreductase
MLLTLGWLLQIFLATKFGSYVRPDGTREIKNDPEYIRDTVKESLRRLRTDYIDLLYWYVHVDISDRKGGISPHCHFHVGIDADWERL